ncbi:hypothetical protein BGX21_004596, partial [Mortierella sp. AD011]
EVTAVLASMVPTLETNITARRATMIMGRTSNGMEPTTTEGVAVVAPVAVEDSIIVVTEDTIIVTEEVSE